MKEHFMMVWKILLIGFVIFSFMYGITFYLRFPEGHFVMYGIVSALFVVIGLFFITHLIEKNL